MSAPKKLLIFSGLLCLALSPTLSRAQSDPDESASESTPLPRETAEPADTGHSPGGHGLPALIRIGLKAGGQYSYFQTLTTTTTLTPNTTTLSGPGIDVLASFGWDLPYQPIFLELESGYQGLLLTSGESLNVIPLRFGVFRRLRTGPQNLFKFGVIPALNFETTNGDGAQSGFAIIPSVAVAAVWEFGAFLIQPEFTLYRINSGNSRFSFGGLVGFRF